MYTFSFERLEVWNKSRLLTMRIYSLTQSFPESEKFGMVGQLRRAVISICSNIAEGSSRKSKKDQVHFYNIAFSSFMETLNQLIISNDLEYFDNGLFTELRKDIHVISLMLNNLCNSIQKKGWRKLKRVEGGWRKLKRVERGWRKLRLNLLNPLKPSSTPFNLFIKKKSAQTHSVYSSAGSYPNGLSPKGLWNGESVPLLPPPLGGGLGGITVIITRDME
jgi:four helix bundle protein